MTKEEKDGLEVWRLNDTRRIRRCVDLVEPEHELLSFYMRCAAYCSGDGQEGESRLFLRKIRGLHALRKIRTYDVNLDIVIP